MIALGEKFPLASHHEPPPEPVPPAAELNAPPDSPGAHEPEVVDEAVVSDWVDELQAAISATAAIARRRAFDVRVAMFLITDASAAGGTPTLTLGEWPT
jgi:hypothetical protein